MARTSEINLGLPRYRELAVFLVLWRNILILSELKDCEDERSVTRNLAKVYFSYIYALCLLGYLNNKSALAAW